ncbi:unnamed protein product [Closterium sp. NIES-53]
MGYQGCSLGNAAAAASSSSNSSRSGNGNGGLGDSEGERYGLDPFLANYEGVGGEPYVPRPIVSVHVRQGDKGFEMQLFSFYAYMFMANRIRRGFPGVRYVWLGTEMQHGDAGEEGGEGGAGERVGSMQVRGEALAVFLLCPRVHGQSRAARISCRAIRMGQQRDAGKGGRGLPCPQHENAYCWV